MFNSEFVIANRFNNADPRHQIAAAQTIQLGLMQWADKTNLYFLIS